MLTVLACIASYFLLGVLLLAVAPVGSYWVFDIGRYRFGVQHDLIEHRNGNKYLERWLLWFGFTLRLHKFWSGDDDRAPHDHPWPFVTFPLAGYYETVYTGAEAMAANTHWVEPFRFHYRPAAYKHIVRGGAHVWMKRPIYTLVATGHHKQHWGFYPFNMTTCKREYIYWRNWK